MLRRQALGELPLALTPFVNCTIDESPKTVTKLIPIVENKLFLIHYFTSHVSNWHDDEEPFIRGSRLLAQSLQKPIGFTPTVGCRSRDGVGSLNNSKDQQLEKAFCCAGG